MTSATALVSQLGHSISAATALSRLFILLFFLFIIVRPPLFFFFFLNDPAPTDISPLPLHDPLPICSGRPRGRAGPGAVHAPRAGRAARVTGSGGLRAVVAWHGVEEGRGPPGFDSSRRRPANPQAVAVPFNSRGAHEATGSSGPGSALGHLEHSR